MVFVKVFGEKNNLELFHACGLKANLKSVTSYRAFQFLSGGDTVPWYLHTPCSENDLFPQLLTGRYRETQTSITDTSAVYRASSDKVSRWSSSRNLCVGAAASWCLWFPASRAARSPG